MSLLTRLFTSRRKTERTTQPAPEQDKLGAVTPQVRVVVLRECERRGRRLLYDSNNQTQANNKQCSSCEGDAHLLGEMVFGSVAMNHRGLSFKVHILKSPHRLMCTKVFSWSGGEAWRSARSSVVSNTCGTASGSGLANEKGSGNVLANEKAAFSCGSGLGSEVGGANEDPDPHDRLTPNWSSREDSGFYGDTSSNSSVSSYCNFESLCSVWDREEAQDNSQLFEFGYSFEESRTVSPHNWRPRKLVHTTGASQDQPGLLAAQDSSLSTRISNASTNSDLQQCSWESLSSSSKREGQQAGRRGKVGLAIIITLLPEHQHKELLQFLLEHCSSLEAALSRLRGAACSSSSHNFISRMNHAAKQTSQWLLDLVCVPPVQGVMWPTQRLQDKMAASFLSELCWLLTTMDTKDTYFFMSTLVTNVLTYHLGWVTTVSGESKPAGDRRHALRTQLGQLHGAVGRPARLTSTIVYSRTDHRLVSRVLTALTYFIRCGEVKRYQVDCKPTSWETIDSLMDTNEKVECINEAAVPEVENVDDGNSIEMRTFSSSQGSVLLNLNSKKVSNYVSSETFKSKCKSGLTRTPSYLGNLKLSENDREELSTTRGSTLDSGRDLEGVSAKASQLSRAQTGSVLFKLAEQTSLDVEGSVVTAELQVPIVQGNAPSVEVNNEVNLNNKVVSDEARSQAVVKDSRKTENGHNGKKDVLFVLGDDEALVGLKTGRKLSKGSMCKSSERLVKQFKVESLATLSAAALKAKEDAITQHTQTIDKHCCLRTQCTHSKFKKHSGVKFEFDKYPQIVTNYMKSKNLELLDRHVIGKPGNLKLDSLEISVVSAVEGPACRTCSIGGQALQTPSNASELEYEYTTDLPSPPQPCHPTPVIVEPPPAPDGPSAKVFVRRKSRHAMVMNASPAMTTEHRISSQHHKESFTPLPAKQNTGAQEEVIELPMPTSILSVDPPPASLPSNYCCSLLRGVSDHYIPDMVLQGCVCEDLSWQSEVKRDVRLASGAARGGAACLLVDAEQRRVRVVGAPPLAMSALVAAMLDALPHMHKANIPAPQCLEFIESKLRELWLRSVSLASLLMGVDFCDMEQLTRTLQLEPNDVPLLLAVASTHCPQLANKYGVT